MVNWSYKSSSYMILRKNESLKATTKQCVILKGWTLSWLVSARFLALQITTILEERVILTVF